MSGAVAEPFQLDVLAGQWTRALEAARSALQAAGPCLDRRELVERGRRLVEERRDIACLLRSLARDLTSPASTELFLDQRKRAMRREVAQQQRRIARAAGKTAGNRREGARAA